MFIRENDDKFEQIARLFYERNFGTAGKSDIELLMFHLFMEQRREFNESLTDYSISNELGITQQRVRNLKIKEQLKYPRMIDWQTDFAKLLNNARYDDPNIIVDVPDPNLLIEIKNYLEEHGKYVNVQRNSRLLSMRIEFYVDLAIDIEGSDEREVYNSLIKKLQETNKYEEGKLHPTFNKCKDFLDVGVSIADIVVDLATIVSPNNLILQGIRKLI